MSRYDRKMEPLHLLPPVTGTTTPYVKHKDLPVPVIPLPKPPKRMVPGVPVKPAGKAPKTKMAYGMIAPVKEVRSHVPHEYTG